LESRNEQQKYSRVWHFKANTRVAQPEIANLQGGLGRGPPFVTTFRRKAMNKPTVAVLLLSSVLAAPHAVAQTTPTVAPDNAKSNKVDASNATATADAQTNHAMDLDLTKRIRQSVMSDKSLSTYAHNIKIVTVNGSVTLNGVVRSEDEKGAVEMKAETIAGKNKVTSDLKIAPSK
jgi:hypothetical protein